MENRGDFPPPESKYCPIAKPVTDLDCVLLILLTNGVTLSGVDLLLRSEFDRSVES